MSGLSSYRGRVPRRASMNGAIGSRLRRVWLGGLVAVFALSAGCSMGGRRSYTAPPTSGAPMPDKVGKTVVVIGPFESRVRSKAGGRELGTGMSDALANALLESGKFDVWIDPVLAKRVAKLVDQSPERRERELANIRANHGDVNVVVTGTITDFMHSDSISSEVRRKGLLGGDSNEAVVAFRMNVIDMRAGRVLVTDHVHGLADAPDVPVKELYANVSFGSYLFWSTPLGEASHQAIEEAVAVLQRVVPRIDRTIRITELSGPREVKLSVANQTGLENGHEYHICLIDPATGRHDAVRDPATGRPVMARLSTASRSGPTAQLRGQPPLEVDLRGAVLCDDPIAPAAGETQVDASNDA